MSVYCNVVLVAKSFPPRIQQTQAQIEPSTTRSSILRRQSLEWTSFECSRTHLPSPHHPFNIPCMVAKCDWITSSRSIPRQNTSSSSGHFNFSRYKARHLQLAIPLPTVATRAHRLQCLLFHELR